MAAINVVRVPYKGAGPAVNGLLGGEVQFMLATTGSIAAHIASGKVRALGVSSAKPSALAPGIPPIAASGVPDYEAATIFGVLAPAKTPTAVINRLNQEMIRVLNRPDVKEKFLSMGVEVVASSPQEFAAAIKAEVARMGKVIKEAGLRVE
jgi:tripartite-type tricarboxylate transporter receptor subunit TctC